MATHHFKGGEGALWAQPYGANTQPIYLGCHQIGDVDEPLGDSTPIYCQDESGPNKFKVVGTLTGAAGAITTSVTTDVTDEFDVLERARGGFALYVMLSRRGRKDVFMNFDRAFAFVDARVTSRGLSNLVARTADDNERSEQTFDISAPMLVRLARHVINRQNSATLGDINALTFCNEEQERTADSPYMAECSVGFAATSPLAGSVAATAPVLYTTDGENWAETASDPFDSGEAITGITCFELGRDTTRVVVARGTTDAGAPAEIAYSDDSGTTWTAINVGSVNGQYAPTGKALYAKDRNSLWLVTDDGYIYFSDNAGLTWTAQESGVINSGAWNVVHFADEEVGIVAGAANAIAKTVDGGDNWSVVTGPSAEAGNAILAAFALDRNRFWIGYDGGTMYYTLDGGVTWTSRAFVGGGAGDVVDIKFVNEFIGYMAHNPVSGQGYTHFTFDGGYTWERMTTPANSGLNGIYACGAWKMFVAGVVNTGTGFLALGTV